MSNFKIQVPTEVVRDKNITSLEFVLLVNLMFIYNNNDKDSLTLKVNLSSKKYYLGIQDNRTLKKSLNNLYEQGYLQYKLTEIPRNNYSYITLTEKAINMENNFVQLDYNIIHYNVIRQVGHHGVRLMYYYESYINRKKKQFQCYTSLQTINKQLGLAKPTIVKTNELLVEHKLITKQTFKVENNIHCNFGEETYNFDRFNNHYTVNEKQIDKLAKKKME